MVIEWRQKYVLENVRGRMVIRWGGGELEKKGEGRIQVHSSKKEFIVFFTLLKMDHPPYPLSPGDRPKNPGTWG